MPLLGALLANLLGGVVAFFAQTITKKVAVVAVAIAALGAALATLMVLFNEIVSPFVLAMFSTPYGQFLGLAFPPISGSCIAAIGTTWGACALYKLKVQSIKLSASA